MDIEENVHGFIEEMENAVIENERGRFSGWVEIELDNLNIESPIEQLLYTALITLNRINFDNIMEDFIVIEPQFVIGKYTVDFKVSHKDKCVLVECDSQKFHDRNESERRYEKTRDRDIQKVGYTIFRFTGSEIVKSPTNAAAEIIEYLTRMRKCDILGDIR